MANLVQAIQNMCKYVILHDRWFPENILLQHLASFGIKKLSKVKFYRAMEANTVIDEDPVPLRVFMNIKYWLQGDMNTKYTCRFYYITHSTEAKKIETMEEWKAIYRIKLSMRQVATTSTPTASTTHTTT